jgi:hypothetical protein
MLSIANPGTTWPSVMLSIASPGTTWRNAAGECKLLRAGLIIKVVEVVKDSSGKVTTSGRDSPEIASRSATSCRDSL